MNIFSKCTKSIASVLIISFILSIIINCSYSYISNSNSFLETGSIIFFIRFILIFMFLFFVSLHFIFNIKDLYSWLYKNRFILALIIISVVIVFELNNSSIDLWKNFNLENEQEQSNVIFGTPRLVRSDEWCVYTPMSLSQSPNYKYFNESISGGNTDVFMIYGQPIKDIASIFRPFLLGFLFLGSAKGLSFFWIVRLILLFLVSFEFLMVISKSNKIVSLIGTFLITFAPAVQWWWTPNNIAEIIIYGELLVLLFNNYFIQQNCVKRIIELFIVTILFGSYILILYPAWQIPFAYGFVAVFVGLACENYKNYKFHKIDILPIIICSVLFVLVVLYIYGKSKETIDIISHTAYPGSRFETGGDKYTEFNIGCNSFIHVFRYWGNIFLPFTINNLKTQQCNFAAVFDLFPVGLIISFIVLFKDKIKDKLLIILLFLSLFFTIWCSIGFPTYVAQITLMKVSPAYRTFIVLGFINVLIFVRGFSLVKYSVNKLYSFIISFILAIIVVISNICLYGTYFNFIKIIIALILSLIIFYLTLRNKNKILLFFIVALTMIISGFLVNPINKGINVINNLELLKVIKRIDSEKKGLWMVEGFELFKNSAPNLLITQGVTTLNSSSPYPKLKTLSLLDGDNKYSDIYNRFGHMAMVLNHEKSVAKDKFVLLYPDSFLINVTVKDLLKLNVNYILTNRKLEEFNNDEIEFYNIYSGKTKYFDIYVYELKIF